MKKTFLKHVIALVMIMLFIIPAFVFVLPAQAQINIGSQHAQNIGLGNRDPKSIIVGVIQVILGFLGLLAVIIILIGGFKWMTSGGSDDKVAEARKLIVSGIIGLLIVLAAWGISLWVIGIIATQTGTTIQ
jgi:hypothetical protein